jgi:hypothetical protein
MALTHSITSASSFNRSGWHLGLIPLVVASTGHRHFPSADNPKLEVSVSEVLQTLSGKCQHSPKWLLNGLAEGADRLVARCALSLGWELHAIIPVSIEAFEATMSSDQAREEFRDLLGNCSSVSLVALSADQPEQMFVDVANILCIHAQLLIALWDGIDALGPGGTGEVVKKFREGVREGVSDVGPVYHIYTRRHETDAPATAVGNLTPLHPRHPGTQSHTDGPSQAAQWDSILNRISDYNRLALICLKNSSENINRERQKLGDSPSASDPVIRDLDRLGWIYAVADHLSMKYQSLRKKVFYWMVFWSLFAIVAEQMYSGPAQSVWWLLACLIAAGMAFFPLAVQNKSDIGISWMESMYLDCRALSEACRVQYYWRLLGIRDSAADFYLEEQRDELEWIRQAVRSTDVAAVHVSANLPAALNIAVEKWITGQREFFIGAPTKRNRAKDNQDTADWHDIAFKTALILVILSLGSALVLELASATFKDFKDKCLPWLQMFWGVSLAMSAAIKFHQRTFAFSENARRYTSMGLQVKNVEERLLIEQKNNFEDIDKCRQLLLSYGKAALEESGYWMILLRDRQVRPPIGS